MKAEVFGSRNIEVSHAPDIDEIDLAKVQSTLSGSYDKLYALISNKLLLKAHFKEHQVSGSRKKHEVKLHLSSPGLELSSSGLDWNTITALQKAVQKIEKEVAKSKK